MPRPTKSRIQVAGAGRRRGPGANGLRPWHCAALAGRPPGLSVSARVRVSFLEHHASHGHGGRAAVTSPVRRPGVDLLTRTRPGVLVTATQAGLRGPNDSELKLASTKSNFSDSLRASESLNSLPGLRSSLTRNYRCIHSINWHSLAAGSAGESGVTLTANHRVRRSPRGDWQIYIYFLSLAAVTFSRLIQEHRTVTAAASAAPAA